MIRPHAIEALAEQRDRLTALLRQMDDGRWWSSGKACRLEEDELGVQAERIRSALDVITRLEPELVFIDVEMPELDGFGVIAALCWSAVARTSTRPAKPASAPSSAGKLRPTGGIGSFLPRSGRSPPGDPCLRRIRAASLGFVRRHHQAHLKRRVAEA